MEYYNPTDILNPQAYENPEKFDELFIRLRRDNPVCWLETENYRPCWALTKYADILEVFSSSNFKAYPLAVPIPIKVEEERLKLWGKLSSTHGMHEMDDVDHAKYRAITAAWFEPKKILSLKDSTKAIAKEYVDLMASYKDGCDFAKKISKVYPLRILMLILGLPLEDMDFLLEKTESYFRPFDPEIIKKVGRTDIQATAQADLKAYFAKVVEDRKANPKDDLSSLIANANIDGQSMPELEQLSYFIAIGTAGHDTSGSTIAGTLLTFAQHPEILQQLKSNPALIPSATEEMFRWITPSKLRMRTATNDCEIRGKKIKAGQRVVLCLQSASRDEEVINDPFSIRFDRKPNRHLAFGSGPHICIGMHLVRQELNSLLEELLPRLESVQLNGNYHYSHSITVPAITALPLKYSMK